MYSFSYLEPVLCPMSSSNCCFLTWIQTSQWGFNVANIYLISIAEISWVVQWIRAQCWFRYKLEALVPWGHFTYICYWSQRESWRSVWVDKHIPINTHTHTHHGHSILMIALWFHFYIIKYKGERAQNWIRKLSLWSWFNHMLAKKIT